MHVPIERTYVFLAQELNFGTTPDNSLIICKKYLNPIHIVIISIIFENELLFKDEIVINNLDIFAIHNFGLLFINENTQIIVMRQSRKRCILS